MAYFQSKPTSGRHFLQIPGPSNTPDRVLRAMDNPTMDHRGPDFGKFGKQLLEKLRREYGGEIDVRTLVEEDVNFAPPPSLRSLTVVR